jgi:hypothetical protein
MPDEPDPKTFVARLTVRVRQLRVLLDELWNLATTKLIKKALLWAGGLLPVASLLLWRYVAFVTCQLSTVPLWLCWIEFAGCVVAAVLLLVAGFICILRQAAVKLVLCLAGATVVAIAGGLIFHEIPPEATFVRIDPPASGAITAASPVGLVAALVTKPDSPGGDAFQLQLAEARQGQAMKQTHVTYLLEATTPNRLPKHIRALPGRKLAIAAYVFRRPSGDNTGWSEGDARLGFDKPNSEIYVPTMGECDQRYALVIFVFPLDVASSERFPRDLKEIVLAD